ncbi:3137_t:CDS:2 [Funneliformis mosseae]|uniref:3137_t:CDS:1 n=1 Tax=Funneliformis mosseae TaxID=27381 RepID=A0A9N9FJN8_FUNMO|nr:3137_t:CDS:2 [Funneliformis mosseae]
MINQGIEADGSYEIETTYSPTQIEIEESEEIDDKSSTSESSFPAPVNLHLVPRLFKNPYYKTPKKFKTLKQILVAERNLNTPLDVPTYSNIEAPPSIKPQKKYCDITGLEAKYTDPKTRLRYHSAEVYKEIKQLAPGVIQDYLGLRHAAVVLR